jgi:hypothetical protein
MCQKLQAWLRLTRPAYSSITNWIRALDRAEDISMRAWGRGRLPDDGINDAIAEKRKISPFYSVRSLASAIKSPQETVWCHLHSIGFVVKYFRLVAHTLSSVQKNKRVKYSFCFIIDHE